MSHYRSNLTDLEFALFDVLGADEDYERFGGFDRATAHDLITEAERFSSGPWAESFVAADRTPIELVDGEVELPAELKESLRAHREAGWDRLGLPEELGGMELPPTVNWAIHELFYGANPTAAFYSGGGLFARILFDEGTPEQRDLARRWIDEGWGGTMVLTEPDAGSDVGAGTTKATHVEGNLYHIEGVKRFITSGANDFADNVVHLVLARPEGAKPGTKGLSMFAVPQILVDDDGALGEKNGVMVTNIEKKMGIKGSTTCELTFGAERPAVGYLVGGVHDGIRQMFRAIEVARMTIGTKSAATLSTGYLNALEYAKERRQGADLTKMSDKTAPRVPIIEHPDVRRLLIAQKAYAEGLRALWVYAAWTQDHTILDPDDEQWEKRFALLLPLVKGYSSEKAYELLASSLQVFGGSGYTQDYPIEQYIRDAKIDTVYEGTTGIQALDLFFRKIARDQGETLSGLAAEILEFAKGGGDDDPLAEERQTLETMLEDAQAHVGVLVNHLVASMNDESEQIYLVGLHATPLLETLAELVVSWQLLRQAEVALPLVGDDPFYEGKVASARYLIRDVAPKISARRSAAEAEDGTLMDLPVDAF